MIIPGQVWESYTRKHNKWSLQILKATPNHVEGIHNGRKEYFRRDIFERRFYMVQDAYIEEPKPEPVQTLEFRYVCVRCTKSKSVDEFPLHHKTGERLKVCVECRDKLKSIPSNGRAARRAKQPVPTHSALAQELLDIAARIDALGTPPELVRLAEAVRDVLLNAVDANTVYVVPASTYDTLEGAFNLIKDKITWSNS